MYTWTNDARHHRCLGRLVNREAPADKPCLVDALGGLPISKLAVGGWMTAALSRDKDAYLWGRDKPKETEDALAVLPPNDEEVKLVELDEDTDIVAIGVGSGHAVMLTSDGKVFVIGENDNGQLGMGIQRLSDDVCKGDHD